MTELGCALHPFTKMTSNLLKGRGKTVRKPTSTALLGGLAGATAMALDSLEHIRRGSIGLSLLLVLAAGVAAAALGFIAAAIIGSISKGRRSGSE